LNGKYIVQYAQKCTVHGVNKTIKKSM